MLTFEMIFRNYYRRSRNKRVKSFLFNSYSTLRLSLIIYAEIFNSRKLMMLKFNRKKEKFLESGI